MSPCPSPLHLSPWVCLHLLCLLLLLSVSSSVDPAHVEPQTQVNATQPNCSSGCEDLPSNTTHPSESSPSPNHTSVSHQLNDSAETTASNQQPVLSVNQSLSPETITGPASTPAVHAAPDTNTNTSTTAASTTAGIVTTTLKLTPATTTTASTTTASTTTASTTTASTTTTTTTTTTPAPNTNTTTTASTTKSTAAAPHPVTTATTVTMTTTTGATVSPPPPPPPAAETPQPTTAKPPVQTSAPTTTTTVTTTTVTSTTTTTSTSAAKDPPTLGTRGSMVDEAGDPLTRKLVDTASLLAVLLFGLFFFLVTVAVFVAQAYESYRRKDYTQVDYLINGMYTDSGV